MRSKSITRLRTTALVLGGLGGLAAFVGMPGQPDAGPLAGLAVALSPLTLGLLNGGVIAFMGLVGGALARQRPDVSLGLMTASAIGVLLVSGPQAIVGAALLLVAALLVVVSLRRAPAEQAS